MTAINSLMVLDDANFISTNLLLTCFLLTCIKSLKKTDCGNWFRNDLRFLVSSCIYYSEVKIIEVVPKKFCVERLLSLSRNGYSTVPFLEHIT